VSTPTDTGASRREVRIAHLVATKQAFLAEIESLARRGAGGLPLFAWEAVEDMRRRLAETSARVAAICREEQLTPADLPAPSRRAYQVISFLAERSRRALPVLQPRAARDRPLAANLGPGRSAPLERHVEVVRFLQGVDRRVEASMDHTASLYRIERRGASARLTISEGFLDAPPEVLTALVRLAVPYARRRKPRQLVRDYADGEAFAGTMRQVEGSGGAYRSSPRGSIYDLDEIFETINRRLFAGRLEAPRLLWSDRRPSREFGHYEPATDTIRISRRLDAPDVPRLVLEHVMHHELLHRVLGAEAGSGRRRYHTSRFRREERKFAGFRQADELLRKIAGR